MRQNSRPQESAESHVKDIRQRTRRKFSAEEKIRIVLAGLRGEASIATNIGQLGRLQLVRFEDETQLARQGEGLFGYGGQVPPQTLKASEVDVQQGALEASNVSPIVEMTRMIELVRSYQSAQRMMDTDTELQRKSIQDFTAVK